MRTGTEARDEIADYQGAVRRLTAENKRLMAEMAHQSAASKRRIRHLEVQLHEGLAPELAVLNREMRRWRDRALAAEGRLANLRAEHRGTKGYQPVPDMNRAPRI